MIRPSGSATGRPRHSVRATIEIIAAGPRNDCARSWRSAHSTMRLSGSLSAIEEADETTFWFTLLVSTEIATAASVEILRGEANEIVAILTASQKTAKRRREERRGRKGVKC